MQGCLLKQIALEVANLEAAIAALIKAPPCFAELAEIIESLPNLAGRTSAGRIGGMPELGQITNNVAADLLSAAPYDDDNGKRRGGRLPRADPARSAISFTWRVWEPRHDTTRYSRRSTIA